MLTDADITAAAAAITTRNAADDADTHEPVQIGTHDEDGHRSFTPIGEVCRGCSDPDVGRWVPVSQCPTAWATYRRNELEHGFGAWRWMS